MRTTTMLAPSTGFAFSAFAGSFAFLDAAGLAFSLLGAFLSIKTTIHKIIFLLPYAAPACGPDAAASEAGASSTFSSAGIFATSAAMSS
jgi:hypothetical protein